MNEPISPVDSLEIKVVLASAAPCLRALLNRYQIPSADAEDLIQDAVLAALPKWRELKNKEGWLIVAMRNICSAYRRKQKCWSRLVQATDVEGLQSFVRVLGRPPQELLEVMQDLEKLLAKIDERERRIICLKYLQEMGPAEVALEVGCHPGSVRKTALRTMTRLKAVAVR